MATRRKDVQNPSQSYKTPSHRKVGKERMSNDEIRERRKPQVDKLPWQNIKNYLLLLFAKITGKAKKSLTGIQE